MTRRIALTGLAALTLATGAFAALSITGAGATFPNPMYSKWFHEYHNKHSDVEINYQSLGSGAGIKQVTEGTVDFGATDGPMNDKQLAEFKEKRGCDVLHFPTVLGADVPIYNVPGVSGEMNFTGDALAKIFMGAITKWNDPALVKANPKLKLPDHEILVVHRAESSGTTYVWVDYLSKVNADFKSKVGVATAVTWPVGVGAKGNEGVSGQVKQTEFSIGYVELVYAVQNKMTFGNVQNHSGAFVRASLQSVTEAAAGAASNMPADFRVSITDAPGKGAYPISSFTWLLIPSKFSDAAKKKEMVSFLQWMLADGQKMTADLSYAPLPKNVVAMEQKAIAKIQ